MEAYWRLPIVKQVHVTDEDMDAAVETTYGPPLAVLDTWNRPAVTRAGAVAALKYVQTEVTGLGDGIDAMVKAALGYLESGASS